MEKILITPKTKLFDLLESYPELETVLIEMAPDFKKLRNPVLRNTVARMASLSQAAAIGGIAIDKLVNTLREHTGQSPLDMAGQSSLTLNYEQPEWFTESFVAETMDIQRMLDAGEQPVHEVLSSIRKLKDGEMLQLQAPFLPVPVIEKASGLGYLHWIIPTDNQSVTVWFYKEKES